MNELPVYMVSATRLAIMERQESKGPSEDSNDGHKEICFLIIRAKPLTRLLSLECPMRYDGIRRKESFIFSIAKKVKKIKLHLCKI